MAPKKQRNVTDEDLIINEYLIDQSQNGTNNYMVNVKDVVIITGGTYLRFVPDFFMNLFRYAKRDRKVIVNDVNVPS